ncbi:MAG: phosphoribosylformylglycinamidine synthase subunit PurQ [Planctomycetaceae bacterium]
MLPHLLNFLNDVTSNMTAPRICVLRAPGTNCDVETAHAFDLCGGQSERLHLYRVLESPQLLNDFQILCIPGGFSYGDDIGAGVIFSQQLQVRLAEALGNFLKRDTLILGICNGFQVLLKSGILPNGTESWPPAANAVREATLTWNENGKYTAVWVKVKVVSPQNVFLRGLETLELPVAHAEGRIAVESADVIENWKQNGQIALQYVPYLSASDGSTTNGTEKILPYPDNPNGSAANIAGLSDPTGRVLGLMPHPERFIHATQHPQWTRLNLAGNGGGLKLFQNAVDYFS